jgi:hypothetical protein
MHAVSPLSANALATSIAASAISMLSCINAMNACITGKAISGMRDAIMIIRSSWRGMRKPGHEEEKCEGESTARHDLDDLDDLFLPLR